MYDYLERINSRPVPFSKYTAQDLWTDEHTSARMLAFHLDGTRDVSSRKTEFIDRSVGWMIDRFGLGPGKRVADLGCGPGLYTTRLASSGAEVVGVDFSGRSIRYAREQAEQLGVEVEHVHADYLEYEPEGRFDLVTIIMCDFCALGPAQRAALLGKIAACLGPDGTLLMDVYSIAAFVAREETATYAPDLMDGFWSAEPYYGFHNRFGYEKVKVWLDKYTIIERSCTRVVFNWLQYFDCDALRHEIEAAGLEVVEFLGDVAGSVFVEDAPEFAVVARMK